MTASTSGPDDYPDEGQFLADHVDLVPEPSPVSFHRPTDQQTAIWDELVHGSANVLVQARAGSGKSYVARQGMRHQLAANSRLKIRYAVFNTAMADEFRADCPASVSVATIHSYGYAALRSNGRVVLEKNKSYILLDETSRGKDLPRFMRRARFWPAWPGAPGPRPRLARMTSKTWPSTTG
jgi:hypothetical protein